MAHLTHPTSLVETVPLRRWRPNTRFSGVFRVDFPPATTDLRVSGVADKTITDRVVLKTGPGVEVPVANAKVWLLGAFDGRKVWEGYSDANGYYTATGLEPGVYYIPVAQDLTGVNQAVAAGPTLPDSP